MKLHIVLILIFLGEISLSADYRIQVISRESIYSIEEQTYRPHSQVHFPFLYEAPNGNWYMTLRHGPHGWGRLKIGISAKNYELAGFLTDDRVQTVMSKNNGKDWRPWPGLNARNPDLRFFVTRLRSGILVSNPHTIDSLQETSSGRLSGKGVFYLSRNDGHDWEEIPCEIEGLPYKLHDKDETWAVFWGHIRETGDGSLICSVYGGNMSKLGERITWANGILKSSDLGKTWNYLSTISNKSGLGNEGANETDIARVGPSELIAVYRTGTTEGSSLHLSRSLDEGQNWSDPLDLNIVGGVSPQLLMTDLGVLVLTYGDRDVNAALSSDGGRNWTAPLLIHEGPGTGYTDVQSTGDDTFRIVFDSSTFLEGQEVDRNEILRVEMKIVQD